MTEQANFEAWAGKRWPNMSFDKLPDGSYFSANPERLWEAWQAAQGPLRAAGQAVLERWNSPKWEWASQGPTADLMADLRRALETL